MLNDRDLLSFIFTEGSRGAILENVAMGISVVDSSISSVPSVMEAMISGLSYCWSSGASDEKLNILASELRLLLIAELMEVEG